MNKEDKIIMIASDIRCYYEDWETDVIELIRKFRDELNELLK